MENKENGVRFTVCDGCTECYWYGRDDENCCNGEEKTCFEFIFNEEI